MIIDLIVGCRPNFVKAAAIIHAARKYCDVKINLIHTGQHQNVMSDPYWKDLDLPKPSSSWVFPFNPAVHTTTRLGEMITNIGASLRCDEPDYVMVVGDTDSTLAGAIAASKSNIDLIHVEAGLRCGNMCMQEEINRVMTDSVSDICYTTTSDARDRLIAEGHDPDSVQFVGNVMIDTLYRFLPKVEFWHPRPDKEDRPYAVLTLHRAETVDHDDIIFPLLDAVRKVAEDIDVIWPIHPRLRSRIGAWSNNGRFMFIEPMSYLPFISLLASADFVMTDSGGVQEETTALGIPCLTLREDTERPETVDFGTNRVIGTDPEKLVDYATVRRVFGPRLFNQPLDLWDGHAADRIMEDLMGGLI